MSGNRTKKQHFVPVVYLRGFKTPESPDTRRGAKIWADSGPTVVKNSVEDHCYGKYFYTYSSQFEEVLQNFESDYPVVIKHIREGRDEAALLLQQLVLMHFRNPSYIVEGIDDRHDKRRLVADGGPLGFMSKINGLPEDSSTDEVVQALMRNWTASVISNESNLPFVTSDHPVVLTQLDDGTPGPTFMTVNPREVAVVVRKDLHEFCSSVANLHDARVINSYVATQRNRYIYYSEKMTSSVKESFDQMIERHPLDGYRRGKIRFKHIVDQKFSLHAVPEVRIISKQNQLSFLARRV